MNNKLAIIEGVIILMVLMATVYGGYTWGHGNAIKNQLEAQGDAIAIAIKKVETYYQKQIAEKDKAIAARDAQIAHLRKEYQNIIERLKGKAAEAKAVTPPVNDIDAKQRLEALGYKPK